MKHDVAGRRFGRLVVLSNERDSMSRVPCLCDCGKNHLAKAGHLIDGRVQSCGCQRLEHARSQRNETLEDILAWCKVGKPDECWPWQGALASHGYGRIAFRGVETTAHRAVFWAIHGKVPQGVLICHECDNPPCVNPAHLFAGSYHDNVKDMILKGRARWQRTA